MLYFFSIKILSTFSLLVLVLQSFTSVSMLIVNFPVLCFCFFFCNQLERLLVFHHSNLIIHKFQPGCSNTTEPTPKPDRFDGVVRHSSHPDANVSACPKKPKNRRVPGGSHLHTGSRTLRWSSSATLEAYQPTTTTTGFPTTEIANEANARAVSTECSLCACCPTVFPRCLFLSLC